MTSQLRKTALYDEHIKLKGKMVPFAGWELPIQYSGVSIEHLACRQSAGLFDVSHMGEFNVSGPGAEKFLNFVTTNDVSKIKTGQAQYTLFGNESGGIIDDLIIYKKSEDSFFLVVNASNTEKDFYHLQAVIDKHGKLFDRFEFGNVSTKYSQIALQGPNSLKILKKICDAPIESIHNYHFLESTLTSEYIPALIARTGYTGEIGFEFYIPWDSGPHVWRELIKAGEEFSLTPCGLGCRDTLRAEMKYSLYGNELSDNTSPIEANLSWVVKLSKDTFIGKDQMQKAQDKGPKKRLIGFTLTDRGVPRKDYKVFDEAGKKEIGIVTTGTHSPSLNAPIGIAYVSSSHTEIGTKIKIEIRDKKIQAEICETPFVKNTSLNQKNKAKEIKL